MWWSIAAENMNIDNKIWTCPWCNHKHLPPHKNATLSKLPYPVA
jgi:hypothetical protein